MAKKEIWEIWASFFKDENRVPSPTHHVVTLEGFAKGFRAENVVPFIAPLIADYVKTRVTYPYLFKGAAIYLRQGEVQKPLEGGIYFATAAKDILSRRKARKIAAQLTALQNGDVLSKYTSAYGEDLKQHLENPNVKAVVVRMKPRTKLEPISRPMPCSIIDASDKVMHLETGKILFPRIPQKKPRVKAKVKEPA